MFMHDRDLTDPVFVLMNGVKVFDVQMPKKSFDFPDKQSGPPIIPFP